MRRSEREIIKDNAGNYKLTSKSAFTFVEVLVVVSIMVILCTSLLPSGFLGLNEISPEQEADSAAQWLTRAMIKSLRSRRHFVIECPNNVHLPYFVLRWIDDHPEKEFYMARGKNLFNNNGATFKSFYSPRWGTLTPAMTIRVRNPVKKTEYFIIISGYGRVRTAPVP